MTISLIQLLRFIFDFLPLFQELVLSENAHLQLSPQTGHLRHTRRGQGRAAAAQDQQAMDSRQANDHTADHGGKRLELARDDGGGYLCFAPVLRNQV